MLSSLHAWNHRNLLLADLPAFPLKLLPLVQNVTASQVVQPYKFDHVSPIFKPLHWLPVHHHINFKTSLRSFDVKNKHSSADISNLITLYIPGIMLPSNSENFLIIPHTRIKSFGDRALRRYAPHLLNLLPF